MFPTGFAANLSVLSVFAGEGAHVFSDELNHASIIDGCRLARAEVTVYPHGDLDALDASLAGAAGSPDHRLRHRLLHGRRRTPTSTACPSWPSRHGALLVLDEAHAVLGPELPATDPWPDVLRVGTLSKTLGSLGGFVAGPRRFVELLVNRARPYIFTTAPHPGRRRRRPGRGGYRPVRTRATPCGTGWPDTWPGWPRPSGRPYHPSPIVPVVLGDEADAVAASAALLDPGTVGPGHPPPHRAPRHVAAADHPVGHPHRRSGRRA